DALISNERNKNSLYNAIKSLENVLTTIETQMPEDFISMDLIEAYRYLGEITGESLDEDVIDKIFSEFCLGK
ncbi:MAG: tRNA uridine-5-carboxymethylaminomethyl(34) synthesis GTPase MnmE, partial [Eubacteriales bacterium]|nr:tRNA uridine-5-carboxymethylaminomethyl(34) synthesis GTPase MnmE [Eubacteriales bacterium]